MLAEHHKIASLLLLSSLVYIFGAARIRKRIEGKLVVEVMVVVRMVLVLEVAVVAEQRENQCTIF